jgi:hypothetical protein
MMGVQLAICLVVVGTDPRGIVLGDLPTYLEALQQRPAAPGERVSFRAAWEREEAYRGRCVLVEGRAARMFEAGSSGRFPAVVEVWIVDEGGYPWCVVFPREAVPGEWDRWRGSRVRFEGTFLKLVDYESGDGRRRAPVVAGPAGPQVLGSGRGGATGAAGEPWRWDLIVGVVAGLFVVLLLVGLRMRRMPELEMGPAGDVEFVDEPEGITETGGSSFRDEGPGA